MKPSNLRSSALALLTALIWGTAFVAQSMMTDDLGPFTVIFARSLIAAPLLLGFCGLRALVRRRKPVPGARKPSARLVLLGGLCCGLALGAASTLQQAALAGTTAGKAAFITTLYIVLVPVLGLFIKKKTPAVVWIGVALAVAGLYFLCMTEDFTVSVYDLLLIGCALLFAVHILLVDHFVERVDGILLSGVQFACSAVLTCLCMFLFETPTWSALLACALPVLYVGVFSSCVAYTLQIIAQKGANPTLISLLMSMESLFATLAGAIILKERLIGREILGCALMLAAAVLAQLPVGQKQKAL